MTLEEARKIVTEQDASDPARALEAVAVIVRFYSIGDARLTSIAKDLDAVAQGEK